MWAHGPKVFQTRILEQIDNVQSRDELATYWHHLKPYMSKLKDDSSAVDLAAEIKAAFATTNAEMEGN